MLREFEKVILTEDIPGTELRRGEGYEVEFFALNGETVAVETLESRQVSPVTSR